MPVKLVSSRGYARPEMLTETAWLASRIAAEDDMDIRVVDARPPEQFAEGHIPTAVNLPNSHVPRNNGDIGSPQEFAKIIGELGLAANHTIIVYDAAGPAAGLVAWTLRYMGHRDTRLLDGGLQKWMAEKRSLSQQVPTYLHTIFSPRPMQDLYCSLSGARSSLGKEKTVFLDVRPEDEYAGTQGSGTSAPARAGHIPNAIHLDSCEFFDKESRTLRPAADILALLRSKGVPADARIVIYGQADGAAAMAHLVLEIVGHGKPSTYVGSYGQWAGQSDTPVER